MSNPSGEIDYEALATNVEMTREMIRALVAGFVTDGFTKREAHALTAGLFSTHLNTNEEES